MGPEQDARTRMAAAVFTLVLVLLLLLIIITSDYSSIDDEDELDDEYPDWLEPPPLIVGEDNEWDGRDETLSNPLIITKGTTLKVTRSELRVELIDLVLGNQSWITVEEGGRLELEDTNLSIVYEEWLEDAVVATGYIHEQYGGVPSTISRAVNLEGAERPILSFDLRWYLGRGNLTVAVQPAPGEDVLVLDVFGPDANRTDEWTHHSDPLTENAGQVVRIILFTDNAGLKDVIVGGVLVTDGSSDLPNDRFPTGKAWEDGWKCDEFGPFFLSMDDWSVHFQPLIEAKGHVVIERSRVSAPEALYRHDLRYSSSKYQLQRDEDPSHQSGPEWSMTTGGGHIMIDGGRFVADSAELKNVPIIVLEGKVDIRDSSLEGDADLVTLDRSHGTIKGTHFTTRMFEPRHRAYYSNEPRTMGTAIGISFNSSKGPVVIEDCAISGSSIGLDLNRAVVELRDCSIEGIDWIAIWSHDSEGLGTWEQLSTSNDIGTAGRYQYFKTHTAIFEMEGEGRPREGSVYGVFTGVIEWTGMGYDYSYSLNNRIIHVGPYRTYILMPTLTVNGDGSVNQVNEVVVHGGTSWGGYKYVHLDTDLRSATLQMDPDLAHDYVYWDTDTEYIFSQSYGGGPGRVAVSLDVDVPQNCSDNYWLIFYLDGEVDYWYYGWDANDSRWGNYEGSFNHTFTVPTGLHALGIELVGQEYNKVEPTQLLNDTKWYYRATGEEDLPDAREFVQEGCGTALIDRGLELVMDRLPPMVDAYDEYSIHLMLSEGSVVSVQGEEELVGDGLKMKCSGLGSIVLEDIEVEELVVVLSGCDLTFENVTITETRLQLEGGEHRIRRFTGLNGTTIHLSNGAVLQMADSELALTSITSIWYSSVITVSESTAILTNITVGDEQGRSLSVGVGRNGTFELTNSTFHGGGLGLYSSVYTKRHLDVNASVLVSDCEFLGEDSHINVRDHSYSWIGKASFRPDSRIRDNVFSGESRLICHRHLIDWLFEDNVFGDGSSFYAIYELSFNWPENVSSSDHVIEYRLDEDVQRVSEELLGSEWERWDPIYAKGTLDPLTVVDPEPVPIVIMGTYYSVGHSSMRWVMGFSYVDPTEVGAILEIPQWESIADLIWSHFGDAWNQGQ